MNYKKKQLLKGFLPVCCYCLDFKASTASPIFEMLNGYNDKPHPEFLIFVYANLF